MPAGVFLFHFPHLLEQQIQRRGCRAAVRPEPHVRVKPSGVGWGGAGGWSRLSYAGQPVLQMEGGSAVSLFLHLDESSPPISAFFLALSHTFLCKVETSQKSLTPLGPFLNVSDQHWSASMIQRPKGDPGGQKELRLNITLLFISSCIWPLSPFRFDLPSCSVILKNDSAKHVSACPKKGVNDPHFPPPSPRVSRCRMGFAGLAVWSRSELFWLLQILRVENQGRPLSYK